jgi:hypothetical protein
MTFCYDPRIVPSHGKAGASVFLMNEAPGPFEAESGIPLFGRQGGNIFRALRKAGIGWAMSSPAFVWPEGCPKQEPSESERRRDILKSDFLRDRAIHLTCTNAYSRWPKSGGSATRFLQPKKIDVLSDENLLRIRSEVSPNHSVLLICGRYAYLGCIGTHLLHPSSRERTQLTVAELRVVNDRLQSHFKAGWYMGHTRRWSLNVQETTATLRLVARSVAWALEEDSDPS